jgi:hypothetical protein
MTKRRKPSACELVAGALNQMGVPSDDGSPWTEDMVAAIYDRMKPMTDAIMRDGDPKLVNALLGPGSMAKEMWPAVEQQAAKHGLKAKPTH